MFKLAGHLGMTTQALMETLSEDELVEWLAYDRLDPIGGYRQDLNTALLAMMQSDKKKAKLNDFILIDPNPVTEEEAERQKAERKRQKAERKQQKAAKKAEQLKALVRKRLEAQSDKRALPSE